MLISTDMPDHPFAARLLARIPTGMNEREFRDRFERPLCDWLTAQLGEYRLDCFALPQDEGQQPGFGVAMQAESADSLIFAVERIAKLGAPPETRIELETDKALIEMTLAEIDDEAVDL